jgi:hypothetical protein
MRLPMISGIVADSTAEFLQSYPTNLEIVAVDNKIAKLSSGDCRRNLPSPPDPASTGAASTGTAFSIA